MNKKNSNDAFMAMMPTGSMKLLKKLIRTIESDYY